MKLWYRYPVTEWLSDVRERWPDAKCVSQGKFGLLWREHFKDNMEQDYRFVQRGTGIGGSDSDKKIQWFMNRDFRLALLGPADQSGESCVIDFTRYDLSAQEPSDMTRRWSLMGTINQKQTRPQDIPVPLHALSAEDQAMILSRYRELGDGAEIPE